MDITSVNGNNSWKFQDDTMRVILSKKVWQTDRRTDENKCSLSCLVAAKKYLYLSYTNISTSTNYSCSTNCNTSTFQNLVLYCDPDISLKNISTQLISRTDCPYDGWKWLQISSICICINQQGKSEGFDSCNWPNNLTQTELKLSIFQPVWHGNLMDELEKQ